MLKNLVPLRNIENGTGSGGTPAPVAAPAPAPEPWRNEAEIKANFVKVRALEAQVAELMSAVKAKGEPAPKVDAPAPGAGPNVDEITAQITAQVTFNTALQLTQGLTADQQAMLRAVHSVEKPSPDKIGEWMNTKLAALGRAPGAPQGTAPGAANPPAQTQVRTDLGAPAIGGAGVLPDDPRLIPIEQWKAMDSLKRGEITKRWLAKNGGSSDVLRRNRPQK